MKPASHLPRLTRDLWLSRVTLVIAAIAFGAYVRAEKQLDRANEARLQSYLLADELRQSSDDLTRMVRTYVVTSDPRYKQQTRKSSPSATASSRAPSIIKMSTGIWCCPISRGRAQMGKRFPCWNGCGKPGLPRRNSPSWHRPRPIPMR